MQKTNLELKRKVEEQAHQLEALAEARQEVRGLLKTNEVMREAHRRDQEKIEAVLAGQEAWQAEREQLMAKISAIEAILGEVALPGKSR